MVVEGKSSTEAPVTSGIPQGSVLGPILFLIYINNLPEGIGSNVRLFADDMIVNRQVKNKQDAHALQEDLDKLVIWEQKWLMEYHPDKCQLIRVTWSQNPINCNYYLHGHQLEIVSSTKYLGLIISRDLNCDKHISNITAKANETLGLVKRNLKINFPRVKA